jgi:alkanesulfonate monooxygenase SsuD/methylene tetrahydromethanopterin reductase-like flavin-dependent oxidoreductase (luciferase family)
VVSLAAQAGYGLMAGATSTPDRLRSLIATYREAAPGGDPRMVLARFAFPAETREEAREAARPYLEAFVQRMKVLGVQPHPGETVTFDVEALIDQSLIGSYQEVADKITQIQDEIGVHSVAVIPTSAQFDTVKRVLADMVDEVRPLLPDY